MTNRLRFFPWIFKSTHKIAFSLVVVSAAFSSGCNRERTSMRPVFVTPPGATVIDVPATPHVDESYPSVINPPAPPAAPSKRLDSEPTLNPELLRRKSNSNGDSRDNNNNPPPSPAAEAPVGATLNGPRSTVARSRVATLRAKLERFVDDPGDLFQPPKADRRWKYIVLHHSKADEGGYASIDREHRERLGWSGCGYHFVIGNGSDSPDGRIEVARRWSDQKQGAHCRDGVYPDLNEYGIGVCLVGDLDKAPPTSKQVEAAKALVAYLSERYKIPAERIAPHSTFAKTRTDCPGARFPVQSVLGRRVASRPDDFNPSDSSLNR